MKELFQDIYYIARALVLEPQTFWDSISLEKERAKALNKKILFPLAITGAVAMFLGEFFRSDYFRLWLGMLWVMRELILVGVLYYGGIFGTNKILDRFGLKQNEENFQILAVYSMIPYLVISVLTNFLPFFKFLDFAGLYGFYIFWLGSKKYLEFPADKHDNITFKIMITNWIVFGLFSFTTAKLLLALD